MKKLSLLFIISISFLGNAKENLKLSYSNIDEVLSEMYVEIENINQTYFDESKRLKSELERLNEKLLSSKSVDDKVDFLIGKEILKTRLKSVNKKRINDITKIRYIKGLKIIRLLYEKVLSLDHHFTSVQTFSEINKISNPNQYPEYEKLKDYVKSNTSKRESFNLTSILGTNTVVSVINTFSNLMISNLSNQEKEDGLKNVDCILDFTLRMQDDLNTIYFETAFLQKSNIKVMDEIENLFSDYTKPIDYNLSLNECRTEDDWGFVRDKLYTFIDKMNESNESEKLKKRIDLEFSIDRLIQFITHYNNFINDGEDFYQKFKIMLGSYENEQQCNTSLPIEYKKLKNDIDLAIEKFSIAYKPIEVNGSKMKELLYGINEYDY